MKTLKLKRLMAICHPDKRKWLEETLKKQGAFNITIHLAESIVKNTFINMLGFNDTHRILMTSYIDETHAGPLIEKLKNELFYIPENGIAFMIKVDAYAGAKSMMLIDQHLRTSMEDKNGK